MPLTRMRKLRQIYNSPEIWHMFRWNEKMPNIELVSYNGSHTALQMINALLDLIEHYK